MTIRKSDLCWISSTPSVLESSAQTTIVTVWRIEGSVVFATKRIWSRLCVGVPPRLHLSCLPPRRHQKTGGSIATQTHRGLQEEEEEREECVLGWGLGHGWTQFKYSSVRYDSQTDLAIHLSVRSPPVHPSIDIHYPSGEKSQVGFILQVYGYICEFVRSQRIESVEFCFVLLTGPL